MLVAERIHCVNFHVLEIHAADLLPLQAFERIRQQHVAVHANALLEYFIRASDEGYLRKVGGRVKRGPIDYQFFKRRFHRPGIANIEFARGARVTSPNIARAAFPGVSAQPEAV
jgi:hypothetical protein